jgi:hypothetical protein
LLFSLYDIAELLLILQKKEKWTFSTVQLGWFVDGLPGQGNLTCEETNKHQIFVTNPFVFFSSFLFGGSKTQRTDYTSCGRFFS